MLLSGPQSHPQRRPAPPILTVSISPRLFPPAPPCTPALCSAWLGPQRLHLCQAHADCSCRQPQSNRAEDPLAAPASHQAPRVPRDASGRAGGRARVGFHALDIFARRGQQLFCRNVLRFGSVRCLLVIQFGYECGQEYHRNCVFLSCHILRHMTSICSITDGSF